MILVVDINNALRRVSNNNGIFLGNVPTQNQPILLWITMKQINKIYTVYIIPLTIFK